MDSFDEFWETVEASGVEYVAPSLLAYAETLILNSSASEQEKENYMGQIEIMTFEELKSFIENLQSRQTCSIESGRNYRQTEIKKKLKQMMKYD